MMVRVSDRIMKTHITFTFMLLVLSTEKKIYNFLGIDNGLRSAGVGGCNTTPGGAVVEIGSVKPGIFETG